MSEPSPDLAAIVDAMAYDLLRKFLQKSDALEVRELIDSTGMINGIDEGTVRAFQYDVMHGLRWQTLKSGGANYLAPFAENMVEDGSEHLHAKGQR